MSESVVPQGKHFIGGLTVAEADMASRRIEANIDNAVDGEKRFQAFAVIAEIWERRSGGDRREGDFLKLDTTDIYAVLGLDGGFASSDDDQAPPEDFDENPTACAGESS